MLAPYGIIPHAFDQERAIKHLVQWVEGNKIKPNNAGTGSPRPYMPRGVYLPLWTFDLGAAIDYMGEMTDRYDMQYETKAPEVVRVNDGYPVQINDLPIPASRKPSAVFLKLIPTFELSAVKTYEAAYLAN